jgi:prenylcysteine alpha-carboxyl methylesterase
MRDYGILLSRLLDTTIKYIPFRNFPQGTIGDMVHDASQGISFVCNNIASYGGDPNQ